MLRHTCSNLIRCGERGQTVMFAMHVEDVEPCNLSCLMSCFLSNSPFPRRPLMISLYGVVCMSRVITFRRRVRGTYNLEELAFSFVFPSVTRRVSATTRNTSLTARGIIPLLLYMAGNLLLLAQSICNVKARTESPSCQYPPAPGPGWPEDFDIDESIAISDGICNYVSSFRAQAPPQSVGVVCYRQNNNTHS